MAPVIETGHAKNVANFADIISFCTGYGLQYNPGKAALKVINLNTLLANAQQSINQVNVKNTDYNNTVNNRMIAFKALRPLSTRIINALGATDANDEVIKDAKTINRKIQGQRAKTIDIPVDPNAPAPNNVSASQQSYDQLIEHFERMVILLQSEPTYLPNEVDLQTAQLEAYKLDLKARNQAVTDAYTAISNTRITRNDILYKAKTGLVDIAYDVKQYIKSLFGASSPQYKQVSGVKFTTPKK